ncbi:alcohol dehydrogenase [Fusarium oxysporum f. sp. pisi HDV247]|uniref:Alcohol dehydrogenase n=1 Tax=Fusarium oxysporum f. sp. pisi HDV247 TaxID=1080344 RepID=W9NBP6_FUSOX|nr:alcohol dehydrogenase [Fusarium oxysporum f. sp. pisi HDV247]
MAPQTQKQWVLGGNNGFGSLEFQPDAPVPSIGDREVLVRFHAASLNFRDLIIAKGQYPFPAKDGTVPVADGAGVVAAVGSHVSRFQVGDRVVGLFHQNHLAGPFDASYLHSSLGGSLDGTLREYGAFPEQGLVRAPINLSLAEAASLPCAALTAWSALFPDEGRVLRPGDTVLTEGTGGVSTFAIMFAKAAGARVIATTSSDEKAQRLKELGADHVLNYIKNPNWGALAKSLTPNKSGVDVVVEVGGPASARQALTALKTMGVISMVGSVASFASGEGMSQSPTFLDTILGLCTVRGVTVGSRRQFEEMNRAIEENDIHPVLDKTLFKLEHAREAYEYLWDQKHIGKVIVQIVDA